MRYPVMSDNMWVASVMIAKLPARYPPVKKKKKKISMYGRREREKGKVDRWIN